MGLAASQARFLGLTARKTNVEYEGQQVNQQRTMLANESANYYNDLLGMSVPVPPSVDDYTKTVYTFNDGALTNQITAMIAQPNDPGKFTISYLSRWQEDFVPVMASTSVITQTGDNYFVGATSLRTLGAEPEKVVGDRITIDGQNYDVQVDEEGKHYINKTEQVASWIPCTDDEIKNLEYYQFDDEYGEATQIYKKNDGSFYQLDESGAETPLNNINEQDLVICLYDDTKNTPEEAVTLVTLSKDNNYMKETTTGQTPRVDLNEAQIASITSYSGGIEDLTDEQVKALLEEEQAYKNMLNEKYNSGDQSGEWFVRYVENTTTSERIPYFYKSADVQGANYIDGASRSSINCYSIGTATKTEEFKGIKDCKVEQDASGRYINVTIPDGNGHEITYELTTTTSTDQDAYNDAMNQYEFEKANYDKAVQDINSKIEIIQSQDKNLELRLKQLDTEQDALSTELDSVQKVIEKNVEGSFKTFG